MDFTKPCRCLRCGKKFIAQFEDHGVCYKYNPYCGCASNSEQMIQDSLLMVEVEREQVEEFVK